MSVLEYSSFDRMEILDGGNLDLVASTASPFLRQSKEMGRLPSRIWQETAERMPSFRRLLGNRKGMMVGGAEVDEGRRRWLVICHRGIWGEVSEFVDQLKAASLWRPVLHQDTGNTCHPSCLYRMM